MLTDQANIYTLLQALIVAIPSIIAAAAGIIVASRTKSSNGSTIAQTAERGLVTANENNAMLRDQQGIAQAVPEH